MNTDGRKGKLEKFIDDPGISIEQIIKDLGTNKKFITVIDSPGIAIEHGVKKSWEYILCTGKELKKTVTKKTKKHKKTEKNHLKYSGSKTASLPNDYKYENDVIELNKE